MSERFDIVVIGSGSTASQIAYTCREAGKSVAVIDSKPFGGTCSQRGCDPKRVLAGAADLVDWARRMRGKGFAGDARIDWPELMRFKRTFTDPIPQRTVDNFRAQGIESIHGRAHFISHETLEVNGREIRAQAFALACGARAAHLGIAGEELLIDNERFLDLEQMPGRVLFVGGGYIAFEFAHLSARAGAEVTIIDNGPRPLRGFDPDLVDRLAAHTRAIGIDLRSNTKVDRVERGAVSAGGQRFTADLLVHAAGRTPDIDDLALDRAGVERTPKGVKVDRFLRSSSNPGVFAAGDCADSGNPQLTPVAGYEGRIAAANILSPESRPISPHIIPSTVFSVPPLARVGMMEEDARAAKLNFKSVLRDSSDWYSSRRVAEKCSASKLVVEEGSGKILGAHLLGHESEELINIFAVAIAAGYGAADLEQILFSYPTRGSDIQYMF
jgi:glutathione reductase (NADPH)